MNRKRGGPRAAPSNNVPETPMPAVAELGLGADFPSPRALYVALSAIGALAIMVFLALLLKFYFPGSALLARVDTGALVVGGCLVMVAGSGAVHPAFGLAVLAFLRHWLDGLTYPGDEAYFTCSILFLFVLWGVRVLMRGGRIRFGVPLALLGGYLIIGVMTSFASYQFDTTYHRIVQWSGFLALFLLATNALRSRGAIAVVIGGFVAGELCHAVYAFIQYKFVFEYTRQQILQDPRILYQFFGVTEPTPELLRRLNINRAFGTMLFPNALGAFLILGIPLSIGAALHGILRHNEEARAQTGTPSRVAAFRFALVVLVIALLISLYLTGLYVMLAFIQMDIAFMFGLAFGGAVLVGVVHGFVAYRYAVARGIRPAMHGLAAYFFLCLVVAQTIGLVLTFSRGAMLALILVTIATAVILWTAWRGPRWAGSMARAAAALSVVACALAVASGFGIAAVAQEGGSPEANTGEVTAAAQPELPAPHRELLEQGANLTMKDMLDPASFALRGTYLKVGLRMAADNLFTGVGWGNFGVAYPTYQTVDAGDVQTAHNDYLQALCETGVFGFLAFTAFWGYFTIWGVRRLLRERHAATRWMLAGLYAGPLAFLIHALVDFNFYNTSLVFYIYLVSGLFYAWAAAAEPETQRGDSRTAHQVLVLALLVGGALVAGMSLRAYRQHRAISGNWINVASQDRLNRHLDTGRVCLTELFEYGMAREQARREGTQPAKRAPGAPLPNVLSLLQPGLEKRAALEEIRQTLERFGTLATRTPGGGWRRLLPGDPLQRDTWIWFDKKPWAAMHTATDAAEVWIRELERLDRMFPHRPELAAHILDWYDMLVKVTFGGEEMNRCRRYMLEYTKWAEQAVARSPRRAEFRTRYGLGLWHQGYAASAEARDSFFEQGIEQFRMAQRFRPEASPGTHWDLANALESYGNLLIADGRAEKGKRYVEESKVHRKRALAIQDERIRLGLPF